MIFWQTLGQTSVIFALGIVMLKWINDRTVALVVNHTGKSNNRLWFMQPGILIHELWHALVAILFGIRVKGLSMRADYAAGSAAHVTMAYNPHNLWHQTGMFLAATAPVWGNALVINLLSWRAFYYHTTTFSPDWPWVIILTVVGMTIVFGISPSWQDLRNAAHGLPFFLGLLLLVWVGLYFIFPSEMVIWQQFNRSLLVAFTLLTGYSVGIQLLLRGVLWRH